MAKLSIKTYEGDGSTTAFTTPVYINQSDITVYIDGTENTDFTWTGDEQITFDTAPSSGAQIKIERSTSRATRLVDYENGSDLNETTLDKDSLQAFYMAQEGLDVAVDLSERALKIPDDESVSIDLTLPALSDRLSKVLGFDSSGEPVAISQLDKSADTVTATGSNTAQSLATLAANWLTVEMFFDETTSDDRTDAFTDAFDRLEALGGGTLFCLSDSYIANIIIPDNCALVGRRGQSTIRPATGTITVKVEGENVRVENIYANASDPDDDTTPLGTYGFQIRNGGCSLTDCGAEGARFDSLYIALNLGNSEGFSDFRGTWNPSARNTASVTHGHRFRFTNSFFKEEKGTYDASANGSFDGLYMFDIEPNPGEQAYDFTFEHCIFERETTNVGNLAFMVAYSASATAPPDGRIQITMTHPIFRGAAEPGIRIKDSSGKVRGFNVYGGSFVGRMFVNDGTESTNLYDSVISGVEIGNANLTFGCSIADGCVLQNITTTDAGNAVTVSVVAGTYPVFHNVEGVADRIGANGMVMGADGVTLKKMEVDTVTVDPTSIAADTRGSVSFTLTGAATGDPIFMEPNQALDTGLAYAGAKITAADTATVYISNLTTSAIDASATVWRYIWFDVT